MCSGSTPDRSTAWSPEDSMRRHGGTALGRRSGEGAGAACRRGAVSSGPLTRMGAAQRLFCWRHCPVFCGSDTRHGRHVPQLPTGERDRPPGPAHRSTACLPWPPAHEARDSAGHGRARFQPSRRGAISGKAGLVADTASRRRARSPTVGRGRTRVARRNYGRRPAATTVRCTRTRVRAAWWQGRAWGSPPRRATP